MDDDIRDDEEDEFRDWVIEWIGADVSILGPGQLEIRLRRFGARKVQRLEGSAEELGLEEDEGLFTMIFFLTKPSRIILLFQSGSWEPSEASGGSIHQPRSTRLSRGYNA